jgi:hypothetical protein
MIVCKIAANAIPAELSALRPASGYEEDIRCTIDGCYTTAIEKE